MTVASPRSYPTLCLGASSSLGVGFFFPAPSSLLFSVSQRGLEACTNNKLYNLWPAVSLLGEYIAGMESVGRESLGRGTSSRN